jgi:cobaltochelatase CobN
MRAEAARLIEGEDAERPAAPFRVFGSKPGAYGAGLQALIDERRLDRQGRSRRGLSRLGRLCLWRGAEGKRARASCSRAALDMEAVVQNQDNREHDLLDSDDYYQFEGGMTAAVETLQGGKPARDLSQRPFAARAAR